MSFFDCLVTSHSALKVHPAAACVRMYSLVEASPASALMPSFPLKLPWQHPEPTPAQRQARTLSRTWPAVPACHGNAASVCCVCLPPHRQMYPLPTRPGTETQPHTHTHTPEPRHTPVHANSAESQDCGYDPRISCPQPFLFLILCRFWVPGPPGPSCPQVLQGPAPERGAARAGAFWLPFPQA